MKRALIIGITGQDGSYLAELLLEKDYEVHGLLRRSSSFNTARIAHIYEELHDPNRKLFLHYGDLADGALIARLINELAVDEIYNLGAQSHVRVSFDIPEYTSDITALGTLRILEAIRGSGSLIKFYQACSSEMFGNSTEVPQRETTIFYPRSPYACAKAFSYWITKNYREAYGIFAVNGILFNHESIRRGRTFVSKKITEAIGRIKCGLQKKLYLGNMRSIRDWGYAPEYVYAMWKMMQHEKADDFVVATGEGHTVQEFVERAFSLGDLDWKEFVEIDERFLRPTEVNALIGDYSKARKELGWEPAIKFNQLVRIMVEHDIAWYADMPNKRQSFSNLFQLQHDISGFNDIIDRNPPHGT